MPRRHNATGRSNGGERHVRLPLYLLQSVAYRSLSLAARAVLVEAVAFYDGSNNGYLILPARTMAERIGKDHSTAARALRELDDAKFIEPMANGSFSVKRKASEYRLTWLHCDRGHMKPTKEFMTRGSVPATARKQFLSGTHATT
jgi:hypothetical protein